MPAELLPNEAGAGMREYHAAQEAVVQLFIVVRDAHKEEVYTKCKEMINFLSSEYRILGIEAGGKQFPPFYKNEDGSR